MGTYVKHLTPTELLERIADDLAEMQRGGYIDLGHWETALEIVERYYNVRVDVEMGTKRNVK